MNVLSQLAATLCGVLTFAACQQVGTGSEAPGPRPVVHRQIRIDVDPASRTAVVRAVEVGTTKGGLHVEAPAVQDGDPNANPPDTLQVVTTGVRLPGEGTCPGTQNCFDLRIDSFLGRSARQVFIVIDGVTPVRALANSDTAPPSSGLASSFGMKDFGDIPPSGSSTEELRFLVPDLSPYRVLMTMYEDDPAAAPADAGAADTGAADSSAADAAAPADAGVADSGPADSGGSTNADQIDLAFGVAGFQAIGGGTPTLLARVEGRIVVGIDQPGANRLVALQPSTGALDLAFGGAGTGAMALDAPTHTCIPTGVAAFPPDRYVILCEADTTAARPDPGFFTLDRGSLANRRFVSTGALDPTFCRAGSCPLADIEFYLYGGLAHPSGMMLFPIATSAGSQVIVRLLDLATGAVTNMPNVPAVAFANSGVNSQGVLGITASGELAVASTPSSINSLGILTEVPSNYFEGVANGAVARSVTAGLEGAPVFVAERQGLRHVYMVDRALGGRQIDLFTNPFTFGDANAVTADDRNRFYVGGSNATRGYLTRLVYTAFDSTLTQPANGLGRPGIVFPGRTITRVLFDAPTNSLYFAGVAAGQVYVGKLQL